jgi:hypothetical protein
MNEIARLPYTHMTVNKVWDKSSSREVMVRGYTYYAKNGKKRFISKDDLDTFLYKKNDAYQEYIRWRIKQNGSFGDKNHEFYNYYLLWLKEQDKNPVCVQNKPFIGCR